MSVPPKPKQPLNVYFRFIKDNREKIKAKHPDLSITELSKVMKEEFDKIDPKTKERYTQEYNKEKEKFSKEIKEYKEKYGDEIKKDKKSKKKVAEGSVEDIEKQIENLNLPEKPKRPLSVYFLFRADRLKELQSDSDKSFAEINTQINEEYKKLTEDQLKKYKKTFEESKKSFDSKMAKYNQQNAEALGEEKKLRKILNKLKKKNQFNY